MAHHITGHVESEITISERPVQFNYASHGNDLSCTDAGTAVLKMVTRAGFCSSEGC